MCMRGTKIILKGFTVFVICIAIRLLFFENGIEIQLCHIQYSMGELSRDKVLKDNGDWVIISNEPQWENWVSWGYNLPMVDFSKNYLIISRYEIFRLYKKMWINRCLGVPDGKVVLKKHKRNLKDYNNYYYYYLMPPILLSQGVG